MERPLEFVFHNMKSSAELEALMRERIVRLEKIYPNITGCRVSVELKNRSHRSGNLPEIHVELQVPGKQLVVRRDPEHVREQHATADAAMVIRDAFDAMAIQLNDYKRRQHGDVKTHVKPDVETDD